MDASLLNQLAGRAGVSIDAEQIARLDRYLDLLFEANQRMNLTRIADRASAEVQHVGDALTLLPFLPRETHALADVGSGGGVPGVPIAIARPDALVTLIESTKKKAAFLREVVAKLQLKNVRVVDFRAEEAAGADGKLREHFDVVVCRAVATMIWLAEWCLPLTRRGGKMLAMKGPKVAEELPALTPRVLRSLGGGEPIVHPIVLPGTQHRVIVEITKTSKTDKRLPRNPTFAKAKPLT